MSHANTADTGHYPSPPPSIVKRMLTRSIATMTLPPIPFALKPFQKIPTIPLPIILPNLTIQLNPAPIAPAIIRERNLGVRPACVYLTKAKEEEILIWRSTIRPGAPEATTTPAAKVSRKRSRNFDEEDEDNAEEDDKSNKRSRQVPSNHTPPTPTSIAPSKEKDSISRRPIRHSFRLSSRVVRAS